VRTGLAVAIPPGTYARVAPRSGLAVKHSIDTGAGVVDEDYRGEVGVVLFNHGDADFQGAAWLLRSRAAQLDRCAAAAWAGTCTGICRQGQRAWACKQGRARSRSGCA